MAPLSRISINPNSLNKYNAFSTTASGCLTTLERILTLYGIRSLNINLPLFFKLLRYNFKSIFEYMYPSC